MAPEQNSLSRLNGFADAVKPSVAFIAMIFGALVAFEIFNFSTTEKALADMLGPLEFMGLPWSVVLSLAFCGIDFAGIARLFTPEQGGDEPKEVWYLFGAWILAATMNAILTWWGVSMAVEARGAHPEGFIDQQTLVTVIPVFVAVMVWVIRILIIGTLSLSLDRLMHPDQVAAVAEQRRAASYYEQSAPRPGFTQAFNGAQARPNLSRAAQAQARYSQAAPEPAYEDEDAPNHPAGEGRVYHTLTMKAQGGGAPRQVGGEPSGRGRTLR